MYIYDNLLSEGHVCKYDKMTYILLLKLTLFHTKKLNLKKSLRNFEIH